MQPPDETPSPAVSETRKVPIPEPCDLTFDPVEIRGETLSETVLRERD